MSIKKQKKCRICKGDTLTEFLDLGEQPLANAFLKKESLNDPEPKYPLRVLFCDTCGLVQLGDVVDPDTLFRDYVYFSSGMPSSEHYRKYAKEVVETHLQDPHDLVVEIGSNDGHLLSVIKELGAEVLGVDPALNIAEIANQQGVPTLPEFFNEDVAQRIVSEHKKASVIIGNNVVAHIDDHHELARGIRALLTDDGVFIFEAPYLKDMFEILAFDSIYHEHLSYLAVRPLEALFDQFDMEICDVKISPIQGNSLRVYVSHKNKKKKNSSVNEFVDNELNLGFGKLETYKNLAKRIAERKEEVVVLMHDFKKSGKKLAAYGAPARGNTLLNYFNIGTDLLEFATEALPSKIGLFSPGMHIPVIDIKDARKNPPDYYLLLAWNYKDRIMKKEEDFIKNGGRFVVPVGKERII